MNTVVDCDDCAPMELLWGSMHVEQLNRRKRMTTLELSSTMAYDIENFYNPERPYGSLNCLKPSEFEKLQFTQSQTTIAAVPPTGVEPAHMASEANALSAELRGQKLIRPRLRGSLSNVLNR